MLSATVAGPRTASKASLMDDKASKTIACVLIGSLVLCFAQMELSGLRIMKTMIKLLNPTKAFKDLRVDLP